MQRRIVLLDGCFFMMMSFISAVGGRIIAVITLLLLFNKCFLGDTGD